MFGTQRSDVCRQGQRRVGEIADARAAIAVAREEQIAAKRSIRDRPSGEPFVDLIDLFLREPANDLGRQRTTLGQRERVLVAQSCRIGPGRSESDRWQRGRAAAHEHRKCGNCTDEASSSWPRRHTHLQIRTVYYPAGLEGRWYPRSPVSVSKRRGKRNRTVTNR